MPRITVVCSLCGASGVVDSDDIAEEIRSKTGVDVRKLNDDEYDLVQVCEKCAYENSEAIAKMTGYKVKVPGSWYPPQDKSANAIEVFGSGFTSAIIWAAKHLGEIHDIARALASDPNLKPKEIEGFMLGAANLSNDACILFGKIADGNYEDFKKSEGVKIVSGNIHFDPSDGEDVEFMSVTRIIHEGELSARSELMRDFDNTIRLRIESMTSRVEDD